MSISGNSSTWVGMKITSRWNNKHMRSCIHVNLVISTLIRIFTIYTIRKSMSSSQIHNIYFYNMLSILQKKNKNTRQLALDFELLEILMKIVSNSLVSKNWEVF